MSREANRDRTSHRCGGRDESSEFANFFFEGLFRPCHRIQYNASTRRKLGVQITYDVDLNSSDRTIVNPAEQKQTEVSEW
jgi:hypothetical protein